MSEHADRPAGGPAPDPDDEPVDRSLLRLFEDGGDLAIVTLDPGGEVVSWNPGAERLLGYRSGEILGRGVSVLCPRHEAGHELTRCVVDHAVGRSSECDGWLRRRDGTAVWANLVSVALIDPGGALRGSALVLRDASERRRVEVANTTATEQLEELAATDPLTGLRNRRDFDRVLRTIPRERFSVLAIDVDNLKRVNDEFGHHAGDVLLRSIATTLAVMVRGWDTLARLGGDEFAVLLPGAGPEEAARIAERMRIAVHGVPSGTARISVGWSSGQAGSDPRTVWSTSDRHLYEAKRAGRDRVAGGEVSSDEPVLSWGASHDEVLGEVLAGGALSAVYQPVIDLGDGQVLGYEALARPAHFAPTDSVDALFRAARKAGRIGDLDWLCRRAALGGAAGLPGEVILFMNLSATALLDPVHDVDQILLLLRWAGWPAERTVLELGADERITNLGRLREVVADHRREGLRFAGDDPGLQYSTVEVLTAVRPEFLRIDRSLTMTATTAAGRAAIDTALTFARSIGAVVIAEGVENQFVAEEIQALGIRYGQGFGLGEPVVSISVTGSPADRPAPPAALRPLRTRTGASTDRSHPAAG
jgi:diguanylate cyclase (GGDEF)-like protein/PAS domain S-box-containing protein